MLLTTSDYTMEQNSIKSFRDKTAMKKSKDYNILQGMYRMSTNFGPDIVCLRSYSKCFLKADGTPSPLAVKAVRAACGEEGVLHLLAGKIMHVHVRTDFAGNAINLNHIPMNLCKMLHNPVNNQK
ncbi:hypothetical protein CBL_10834 [Carabus blaptoides fortunei]